MNWTTIHNHVLPIGALFRIDEKHRSLKGSVTFPAEVERFPKSIWS